MRYPATSMSGRRNTLVTGGAGFVGSHLVERLVARGDRVIVLDDLSTGREQNLDAVARRSDVELVVGSVLDEPLVAQLAARADEIYHLASPVGVGVVLRDPARAIETIVGGTLVVLRQAARRGCPTLVASSSEVYGPREQGALREDDRPVLAPPGVTRWAYGTAKLAGEHIALAAHAKGLPVVVARLFNVVGPRQSAAQGMVLPRFVAQALSGEPLTIHGDGAQSRCFCDVRDVTEALVRLVAAPAARGRVVNVGSPEPVSIEGVAALVARCVGATGIVKVPYESAYPSGFEEVRTRVPDLTLLRELIAFAPSRSLEQTVRDVAEALRAPAARTRDDRVEPDEA